MYNAGFDSIMKIDAIQLPSKQEVAQFGGRFGTTWTIDVYDRLKREYTGRVIGHNLITNQGLAHINDVLLHGSTQITTWYVILFESNTTPVATHTYAVPVFTEFTSYAEATRPAYVEAAAALSGSYEYTTNVASKAVFTCNASKTIYGGALVGGGSAASTKSDVAGGGTLLASMLLSASQAVTNSTVLYVTVQFNSSSI